MNNKRDNFKRISENRVNKIVFLIDQLKKLTNTSYYEYTEDEINRMFAYIEKETASSKEVLLNNKSGKNKRFEL